MSTQIENDPDKPETTSMARRAGYEWGEITLEQVGKTIASFLSGSKTYILTTYTSNSKSMTQFHIKMPDGNVQRLGFSFDSEGKLLKMEFQPIF
jgi:hypothetical protein